MSITSKGYYHSPIGWLEVTATEKAVTHLRPVKKGTSSSPSSLINTCITQLKEYFDGKRTEFDMPLELGGTLFQQSVWKALQHIPPGTTLSYGQVAKKIGNAMASRAIGSACNRNPIPIIVPCHRVVGSTGNLTGYALGLSHKAWLLKHEKAV